MKRYGSYNDTVGAAVDVRLPDDTFATATIITPNHDVINDFGNSVATTTVRLTKSGKIINVPTGLVSGR